MMIYVHKINGKWLQIHGNPTLSMLDGSVRATWHTIISPGWPKDYPSQFGAVKVDTTAPDGKYWTGEFDDIEGVPAPRFTDIPALIPGQCTPAQGLMALYVLKQITESDIEIAIDGIADDVQRYQAQIAYKKATVWLRDSQSMQAVAQLMGLTETDLDDLFTLAVTFENL